MRLLLGCGVDVAAAEPGRYGKGPSYADIAKRALGRKGEILVCVLSVTVTMSVCVAYLILIGENMHALIPSIPPAGFMWICVPLASLLTFIPDLKFLGFTSILGALSLLLAMGTVIYYGFENHLQTPIDTYPGINWNTLPLWFGTAAFFFCNHIIVVPIANASGDTKRFPRVLDYSMLFITIANLLFAAMGYAFFHEKTESNIIANLPTGIFIGIVRVCICVELLFSFPLVNASGLQNMESGFQFFRRHFSAFPWGQGERVLSRNPWFYALRIVINSLLALIASTITFFGYFVSLVGALMLASAGFILPPIFYLRLTPVSKLNFSIHIAIIVFGIFATSLGTYQAVEGIIDGAVKSH